MQRTGAGAMGPRAEEMIDLTDPEPDWIKLSRGFGVEAVRATTANEFIREFRAAIAERGSRLIEAVI
jgi:acetolactate synthase-1/2/3 large subunit